MARRRELDDLGDGITGHVLWTISVLGFPHRSRLRSTYIFDLMTGNVVPSSRRLEQLASEYRDDFTRHLDARSIPKAWAKAATLTVEFSERTRNDESLAMCRVLVTDDLGRIHSSTRRSGVWHPARRGLLSSLRLSLRDWTAK